MITSLVIRSWLLVLGSFPAVAVEIQQPLGLLVQLPDVYRDQNACPFECCSYGEWVVTEPTVLYRTPNNLEPVTELNRCQEVQAITGEIHVVPNPARVISTFVDDLGNRFTVGERFYLLASRGEGFFLAWAQGVLFEMDGGWVMSASDCRRNRQCWATLEGEPGHGQWWILLQADHGQRGWTNQPNFDGQDLCAVPRIQCDQIDSGISSAESK